MMGVEVGSGFISGLDKLNRRQELEVVLSLDEEFKLELID
jgi:hypothetical protein